MDIDPRNAYIRLRAGTKGGKGNVLDSGWGRKDADTYVRLDIGTVREHAAAGGNLAVLTGKRSGHFCIDVDPKNGGLETFARLEREHGPFPATNRVETPSGGFHLNYALPADFEVGNDVAGKVFGDGIDVKGEFGYRVAPGSKTATGEYVSDGAPYSPAADWMLDLLGERATRRAERVLRPQQEVVKVEGPPECCEALSRAAANRIMRLVKALAALPEGERLEIDGKGRGWDEGFWLLATRLAEIAQWPYTSITLDAARSAFLKRAPADYDAEHKWEQGVGAATGWYEGEQHRIHEHVSTIPKTPNEAERDDDPLDMDETSEFTDTRLAFRFAQEFERRGRPVVYTAGLGWLYWSGKRWVQTDEGKIKGKIMRFAQDWLRDLIDSNSNGDRRGKVLALLNDSRSKRVVSAMQALIRAEAADFDAQPDLLNCRNGVVDLRTGELKPHDPSLLMTKMTRVDFKPNARCADWEKAKEALDADVLDYLLARLGQAATGHTPTDDKVVFNSGVGGNGKSTLLEPVRGCLGTYAGMVPDKLLIADPSAHPTELMTLRGLRLGVVEELPEVGRLNTQRLKKVAGTELVSGRYVFKDFVEFVPTHALFVNTNHDPVVSETDHGTWRRLEKIAFKRRYRTSGIDSTLRQRVKRAEAMEAALADLVRYAGRWYANGQVMPVPPAAVVEATRDWQADTDDVFAFFTERIVADSEGPGISLSALSEEFNAWLPEGRPPWGDRLFTQRLSTNENLPVRFEKRKSRKHVLPSGHVMSEKNPIWVMPGVGWA